MKDLHIHIERGPYTTEWIEKFIEKAVSENLEEICLLEHSVRFTDFYPSFKEAAEYNDYQRCWFEEKKSCAHSLDEFKDLASIIRAKNYPLKVSFGLEVCWFEQHAQLINELTSDGFFDYILGSVHWVDNWTFNQRKEHWNGRNVNHIFERYFELENSLVNSGIFDIIAHPDLITCFGFYPDYDLTDTYKKLCENIRKNNVMMEMNTSKGLGVNRQFFETAVQSGVSFSTRSDAHCPEDVGREIEKVSSMIQMP